MPSSRRSRKWQNPLVLTQAQLSLLLERDRLGADKARKSGLQLTLRWREQDSNHRSRVTRPSFQCRLWLVPRQPKSRSEREPTHEASGPFPAEPMVRILFQQRVGNEISFLHRCVAPYR